MMIRRGIRWGVWLVVAGLAVWGVAWWLRTGTPDVIDLPPARVLLPVKVDGKWGAIDEHGEVVLAAAFDAVLPISLTAQSHVVLTRDRITLWGPEIDHTSWSLLVTQRSVTDWQYRPTWPFAKRRTRVVVEVWDADGAYIMSPGPAETFLRVDGGTSVRIGSLYYRIHGDRLERTPEPDDSYLPLPSGGRLYAQPPEEQNNPWTYELTGPDGISLGHYTADGVWVMDDATMVAAQWQRLYQIRASGESYRANPGGVDPLDPTVSEEETWFYMDETGQPITPEHPVEGIDWRVISLADGTAVSAQDVPILNRAEAPDDLSWDDVVAVNVPHLDRRFFCYVPPGRVFTATNNASAAPDEYALPNSYWVAISATHVATMYNTALSVYTWGGKRVAHRTLDAICVPQFVLGGRNLIALRAPSFKSSILMDTEATPLWSGSIHMAAQGNLVVESNRQFQIIDETGRPLTKTDFSGFGRTMSAQLILRDRRGDTWRLCTADGTLSASVPDPIIDAVIDADTGIVHYLVTQTHGRHLDKYDALRPESHDQYRLATAIWTFDGRLIHRLPAYRRDSPRVGQAAGWELTAIGRSVALVAEKHLSWAARATPGNASQPGPDYSEWHQTSHLVRYRIRVVDLRTGEMWAESPKVAHFVARQYLYVEYWDGRIGYLRPDGTWLWPLQD